MFGKLFGRLLQAPGLAQAFSAVGRDGGSGLCPALVLQKPDVGKSVSSTILNGKQRSGKCTAQNGDSSCDLIGQWRDAL